MKNKLNITIIGIGGVGGYFGGRITDSLRRNLNSDYTITFIARGEHLKLIKQNGLILNTSDQQGIICKPDYSSDNFNDIPKPDIIILAVKSYDLENILSKISLIINDNTIILPLLNGVDIYERIRKIIKNGIVLPACAYVSTHIEKSGVVTQTGPVGKLLFGRDPQNPNYFPNSLIEVLKLSKINFQWFEDPYPAIWEKYMFIAAYGIVTASSNKTIGEVFSDFNLKENARQVMVEIFDIARKKGILLFDYIVEDSLNKARYFAHETKTSYQRDIENKGNINEGDLLGQTILKLSAQNGLSAPVTDKLFKIILEHQNKKVLAT